MHVPNFSPMAPEADSELEQTSGYDGLWLPSDYDLLSAPSSTVELITTGEKGRAKVRKGKA